MKKLLLLICICLIFPVSAEMLQGSASYNVDSVRNIMQDGLRQSISMSAFEGKLYDSNHAKNIALLKKGIVNTKNKKLLSYYNLDRSLYVYGIIYKYDPYHIYYYGSFGMLEQLDISDKPYGEYPNKFYKYNSTGKLTGYGFDVSAKESYNYYSSGSLAVHCVESTCYDENNKVLWTRDY